MNKTKRRPEQEESTTVLIPTRLFKKVEERIKETEFTSVSGYITFVLREVLAEEEGEAEKSLTKEEDEKVKARLRALGYIDMHASGNTFLTKWNKSFSERSFISNPLMCPLSVTTFKVLFLG